MAAPLRENNKTQLTCLATGAHNVFELTHREDGAPGQETEELVRWWQLQTVNHRVLAPLA